MDLLQKPFIKFTIPSTRPPSSVLLHKKNKLTNKPVHRITHNSASTNNKENVHHNIVVTKSQAAKNLIKSAPRTAANPELTYTKPFHPIAQDKRRFNFSVDTCCGSVGRCQCNVDNSSVFVSAPAESGADQVILPAQPSARTDNESNAPLSLYSDAKLYKFHDIGEITARSGAESDGSNSVRFINSITSQTQAEYIQNRTKHTLEREQQRVNDYFKQLNGRLTQKTRDNSSAQAERIKTLPTSVQALVYNQFQAPEDVETPLELQESEDNAAKSAEEAQYLAQRRYERELLVAERRRQEKANRFNMSKEEEIKYFQTIRKLELERERNLANLYRKQHEEREKSINRAGNKGSAGYSSDLYADITVEKVTDRENTANSLLEKRRALNKRRTLKKKGGDRNLNAVMRRQIAEKYKQLQEYIPPICNCKFDQQEIYLSSSSNYYGEKNRNSTENQLNLSSASSTAESQSVSGESSSGSQQQSSGRTNVSSAHANNCVYYNNDSQYYRTLLLLIEQIQEEKAYFSNANKERDEQEE
jgi:hypothetical protein